MTAPLSDDEARRVTTCDGCGHLWTWHLEPAYGCQADDPCPCPRADETLTQVAAIKADAVRDAEALVALGEAVKDTCWRATPYGETDDGDIAYYIVTKGTMHRLIGAAQGAGILAAFRVGGTS